MYRFVCIESPVCCIQSKHAESEKIGPVLSLMQLQNGMKIKESFLSIHGFKPSALDISISLGLDNFRRVVCSSHPSIHGVTEQRMSPKILGDGEQTRIPIR